MIFSNMNPAIFYAVAIPAGMLMGALITAIAERLWLRHRRTSRPRCRCRSIRRGG